MQLCLTEIMMCLICSQCVFLAKLSRHLLQWTWTISGQSTLSLSGRPLHVGRCLAAASDWND